MVRDDIEMKLKEVVARLDEFAPEETIYAEDAGGDARAEARGASRRSKRRWRR
jgi:hypothetical protein